MPDWSGYLDAAALAPLRSVSAFLETGGWVLWLVLGAGVLLWTLLLERWWYFARLYPRAVRDWRADWQRRPDKRSWAARRVRAALLGSAGVEMSATLPMIRTLIAACPLLGLLGTVTGMIQVFDVMALTGTGDAQAMAEGVSRATVPTMAGMVIGISGLLPLNRYLSRVRVETERLADSLSYR